MPTRKITESYQENGIVFSSREHFMQGVLKVPTKIRNWDFVKDRTGYITAFVPTDNECLYP